ncbi:MAG: hypothetical protein WD342_06745 [Verrucomicrobiales bacterium]
MKIPKGYTFDAFRPDADSAVFGQIEIRLNQVFFGLRSGDGCSRMMKMTQLSEALFFPPPRAGNTVSDRLPKRLRFSSAS